tara:strand:- start:290 stop:727 length:438 start_codon:yes stop_codon:yes gene_type:complete
MKSGILLAIGTLVALGLADYVRTAAVSRRRVDNMSFMLIETSTWIVVLAIAMLLRGKGFSMSPKLITLPALAGLLSVSGVLALMMALGMEDGSKVVPIGRLSLILTAILSIIILREPLPAIKLAGLGFGSRSPMVTQSILIITVR